MDDGIHRADVIDLAGKVAYLGEIRQIANGGDRTLVYQFLNGRQPRLRAHMHDDVVALSQQGLGCGVP
ncbi:hypothetical protein D3C72_2442180 [compost metagenome]